MQAPPPFVTALIRAFRLTVYLLVLAACASASLAKAEPADEGHGAAAAGAARIFDESTLGDEVLNQHFFGKGIGLTTLQTGFEEMLKDRVELIASNFGLTDDQRQKLELAGRGDINRYFDDLDEQRKRSRAANGENTGFDGVNREMELKLRLYSQPFGPGSLLSKTLYGIATTTRGQAGSIAEWQLYQFGAHVERDGRGKYSVELTLGHETGPTEVELAELKIRQSRLTTAALPWIRRMSGIVWLDFFNCESLSDAQFASLSNLSGVGWLGLGKTGITDASLTLIGKMDKLRVLSLRCCDITDAGIANLSSMSHLVELDLMATNTGDAGVESLATVLTLKKLDLRKTSVSDQAVEHLRKALPLVRVFK
jgi:hypothetical protein